MRYVELICVLTAVVAPFYFLANEISGDEVLKTSIGAGLAALVYSVPKVYASWTKHHRRDD